MYVANAVPTSTETSLGNATRLPSALLTTRAASRLDMFQLNGRNSKLNRMYVADAKLIPVSWEKPADSSGAVCSIEACGEGVCDCIAGSCFLKFFGV